jgi:LPXTG-motif cell wall-anchored protein
VAPTSPTDESTTTLDGQSGGPTTAGDTTTTSDGASGGPTTTIADGHGLPSTGSDGQGLLLFAGLALLGLGMVFIAMTRRPDEA